MQCWALSPFTNEIRPYHNRVNLCTSLLAAAPLKAKHILYGASRRLWLVTRAIACIICRENRDAAANLGRL